MEIFYEKNGDQIGPIEFEDLKPYEITPQTLVWYKGIEKWTRAMDSELFDDYFSKVPPPLPPKENKIFDNKYEKRTDAIGFGILILIIPIIEVFLIKKILPEEFPMIIAITVITFRILAMRMAYKIANEQNRSTDGWLVFSFFFPSIALIIIGTLSKLSDENRSQYLKSIDEIKDNQIDQLELALKEGSISKEEFSVKMHQLNPNLQSNKVSMDKTVCPVCKSELKATDYTCSECGLRIKQ